MGPRTSSRVLAVAVCTIGALFPSSALAGTDQYRADQWGLDAVAAPEAWQQSTGAGVVVAVVDSGVEITHPDLAANLWTNPDETANGIDDDGNGIVDDLHGANLVDGSADVSDDLGHGTHVAGIIAARAGNGIGGMGLAPDAHIMAVKVYDPAAGSGQETTAAGIRYAVDEGARIINVSMGSDSLGAPLADAVAYASAQGATVVAAAGNAGTDNDVEPMYPASVQDPAVLSVTASNEDGAIADTNFGARSVHLAAPGQFILSTVSGAEYELRGGSSMATPFVSGALALLAAARPDLSQTELREALLATANATPKVRGKVSAGALDVGAAMHRLVEGDWGAEPAVAPLKNPALNPSLRLYAPRKVRQGRHVTLRWAARNADRVATWRVTLPRGRSVNVRGAGRRVSVRAARRGRVALKVTGYDAGGTKLASALARVRVVRAY